MAARERVIAFVAEQSSDRGGSDDWCWATAIAHYEPAELGSLRLLRRQCSRAASADRIAKAIVPVGEIA